MISCITKGSNDAITKIAITKVTVNNAIVCSQLTRDRVTQYEDLVQWNTKKTEKVIKEIERVTKYRNLVQCNKERETQSQYIVQQNKKIYRE